MDITPQYPIYLAGFAHRRGYATKVAHNLYVKTSLIQKDGQKIIFIVADLIWWDDSFVSQLQDEIESKYDIPKEQICFHATHNHSGPQTSECFSKQLGQPLSRYIYDLKEQVLLSIEMALLNMEEVSVMISKGVSNVGIYRRKQINREVNMAPNPDVPTDDEVTLLSFQTSSEKTKAIWMHYSCHPTTTDENVLSSEFTGVCCDEVEKQHQGVIAVFLQGFCGDVRPNLTKDDQFYRGTIEDMIKEGKQLASDIMSCLKKAEKVSTYDAFYCERVILPIRFSNKVVDQHTPDLLMEEWPMLVKRNEKKGHQLIVQYIRIGEQLSFIMCNAELVQAYSFFIKGLGGNILPLGYSNGMVGYIPTNEQLKKGGYEALESLFYFGYPTTISMEMEAEIKQTFLNIIGGKENETTI